MKSPFWTYFHDKLNWLPIFRPGPVSALMRGLALHMDEVRKDILWLREQWNPATCEIGLLERYGASRGIFRTRFDTDESYRKRVIYAYAWHKLGGKVRGLEQIYSENGFSAKIRPAPLKELWAHFRVHIDVGDSAFGPEAAEMSFWIANEYKPARSVLEGIWTQAEQRATKVIGAITKGDTSLKSCLYFPPKKAPACEFITGSAITGHISEKYTIFQMPTQVIKLKKFSGHAVCGFTSSRLSLYWPKARFETRLNLGAAQSGYTSTFIRRAYA